MCTGSDPITNGAPFDVPPHLVHVNNTIIFPPASPAFKFNGFEWTDASAGVVDINLNFQIENIYKGRYDNSADWCNTKGAIFFALPFMTCACTRVTMNLCTSKPLWEVNLTMNAVPNQRFLVPADCFS